MSDKKDKNDLYCSDCGSPLTKALISSLKKGNGIACTKCGKGFKIPETRIVEFNGPSSDMVMSTFNFDQIGLTLRENAVKLGDGLKQGSKRIGDGLKQGSKKIGVGIRTGSKSLGAGARNVIKEGQKIKKGLNKEIKKLRKATK